jgi:hypothetical protein
MATPNNRSAFKEYCLRKLGKPVIEINVDDDQVEDRIDEALKYYQDYHFDGVEKMYLKHQITIADRPDRIKLVRINSGGMGYSNADTVVFTGATGANAAATITTNGNGVITEVTITDHGIGYSTDPTVTITTSGGTGASLTATLGGWIEIPQNIIGVVQMFDLGTAIHSSSFWSVQYQMALNDIWNLSSFSMIPYYINRTQLQLIEQLLVGQKPLRYNRHRNRLHIDMNWNNLSDGELLIIEAYQIVDPDTFTDVWGDRWLAKYCTALIKKQWGNNLKKFSGMVMPGGITFSGQAIYDEAVSEIAELEYEMISSYSLPVSDMYG